MLQKRLNYIPQQDKHQGIFEIINAIQASISDEDIRQSCQDMRDKVAQKLADNYPDTISFDSKLLESDIEGCSHLFCIHYSNLNPSLNALEQAFEQATYLKVPVLFFDWSVFDSKHGNEAMHILEEKRLHLHSKVPIIYILMGCVSDQLFLGNSIANYAIAHQHASIYLQQEKRYLSAKKALELALIDSIFIDRYNNISKFCARLESPLKDCLKTCLPKLIHQRFPIQKTRLQRYLQHHQTLEV